MKTRTTLMLCVLAVLAFAWATPAQAALKAYYDCNEGTGTAVADYVTSTNDGTFQNSMAWSSSGGGYTGLSGDYAIVSNGNASYVDTVNPTYGNGPSAFTITMWLNQTYSYNYADILYGTNGSDRRWFLQEGSGSNNTYIWSDTDGAWQDGISLTVLEGAWHMYTFLYSSSQVKSYVDGVLKDTDSVGATQPTFTSFHIGGRGAAWTSYEGSMDDISIWDENIGEARAKAMYNITTVDSGALVDYTVDKMKALFDVYDTGTPTSVTSNAGTLGWEKFTGGSGTAGAVTFDGTDYFAWFDGTSGVMTPEPATLALMGLGGLGLILGRKRR